jgi:hypothetical protein
MNPKEEIAKFCEETKVHDLFLNQVRAQILWCEDKEEQNWSRQDFQRDYVEGWHHFNDKVCTGCDLFGKQFEERAKQILENFETLGSPIKNLDLNSFIKNSCHPEQLFIYDLVFNNHHLIQKGDNKLVKKVILHIHIYGSSCIVCKIMLGKLTNQKELKKRILMNLLGEMKFKPAVLDIVITYSHHIQLNI